MTSDEILSWGIVCSAASAQPAQWHFSLQTRHSSTVPAEVILFTAGVEDYAAPIASRLQEQYTCFAGRLYRPATVACPL